MRLFNLTDLPLPKQKEPLRQILRKAGIVLRPGRYVETSKNFPLGTISGWVNSGKVAVGRPPDWYLAIKDEKVKARKAAKEEEPPKEEPKEEPEEKKVEVDVGAMKVTVEAGPDGELGTKDDTVDIKPKKSKKRGKKK